MSNPTNSILIDDRGPYLYICIYLGSKKLILTDRTQILIEYRKTEQRLVDREVSLSACISALSDGVLNQPVAHRLLDARWANKLTVYLKLVFNRPDLFTVKHRCGTAGSGFCSGRERGAGTERLPPFRVLKLLSDPLVFFLNMTSSSCGRSRPRLSTRAFLRYKMP